MTEGMVFAAGLGTRLRPLTLTVPKALVTVGGVTMLERTVRRLVDSGLERVVVNVHHHSARIEEALDRLERVLGEEAAGAGRQEPRLLVSREEAYPLDTGGGLKRARGCFEKAGPILLHNVDVVADFPLATLGDVLQEVPGALAVMAVHERPSGRLLLFDEEGLVGRMAGAPSGTTELPRAVVGAVRTLAFTGVHAVSPRIFELMPVDERFSIVDLYLRLAAGGERVLPLDVGTSPWIEIGTAERLAEARRVLGD